MNFWFSSVLKIISKNKKTKKKLGKMAGRERNFKIVLLGEGCVGKTSLTLRYVRNEFNEQHLSTIQASFLPKRLTVDKQRVNLAIWDTGMCIAAFKIMV
jgi:GTPase SAR1 family protein